MWKYRAYPGSNDQVFIQVADNGRGIPHNLRRKIFGRFVRLGLELEREKPGTGLGLYIVRTLVRRLKGRIRVRDPKQGPGTIFEVQLPGSPAMNYAACCTLSSPFGRGAGGRGLKASNIRCLNVGIFYFSDHR